MEVYLLECFTGAQSNGVFPTLEAAQACFADAYKDCAQERGLPAPQWHCPHGNGMVYVLLNQDAYNFAQDARISKMVLGTMYWA